MSSNKPDKLNKVHIVLTATVIVIEGLSLIEKFENIIGGHVKPWMLQGVALISLIPLFIFYRRLNFTQDSEGKPKYRRLWRDASAVLLGLGIVGAILVATRREAAPSELPVLVADIDDYTVERVFSGISTRALLGLALQQSPRLLVFSEDRVVETLDRMKKPRQSRIDTEIAQEICTREGLFSLITWSAVPSVDGFLLQAQISDPRTRIVIAEVHAGPFQRNAIINSIGELATEIQRKFGDSVLQISRSNKPLTRATTSSLPALRAYSDALQDLHEFRYQTAEQKLVKALELDPDFALAMVELASLYDYKGNTQSAIGYLQRAFDHRDHLTEPERVRVVEYYYWLVENDHDKAIHEVAEFLRSYPRNEERLATLASSYSLLMKFDSALETRRKLLGAPPWPKSAAENASANWVDQMAAERISQALETARQINQDIPDIGLPQYMIFISNLGLGDTAVAENQLADLRKIKNASAVLWLSGFLELYRGRPQETLAAWDQYTQLLERSDQVQTTWIVTPGMAHLWLARIALLCGKKDLARQHLNQVKDVREDLRAEMGKYFARLGDVSKAVEILQKLREQLKERATRQNLVLFQMLESEIELAKGNAETSFNLLSQSPTYPWTDSYWPEQETRAYVALATGHPDEALRICNEMLRKKGFAFALDRPDDWVIAHYYLGAAYDASKKRDLALSAYEEFESLWRRGDSQVTLLARARKRIAELQF